MNEHWVKYEEQGKTYYTIKRPIAVERWEKQDLAQRRVENRIESIIATSIDRDMENVRRIFSNQDLSFLERQNRLSGVINRNIMQTLPTLIDIYKRYSRVVFDEVVSILPRGNYSITTGGISQNIDNIIQMNLNTLTSTTAKKVTALSTLLADTDLEEESEEFIEQQVSSIRTDLLNRSRTFAQTTGTQINGAVSQGAFKQNPSISHKRWLSVGDSLVRPVHAELDASMETVPLDAPFSNGIVYPSEFNCRCTILPVLSAEALGIAGEDIAGLF